MQISKLAFIAFPVADLDRSRGFYSGILRCRILEQADEHADFELAGVRLRTYLHRGDYRRQHSGLQFLVSDIDAAHKQLTEHARGPIRTEAWGGRVATLADPDGNLFDLIDQSWRAPAHPPLSESEPLQLYKQILTGQFEASLAMLNACIAACPEAHWEGKIANGSFRWVAYHTLFFVDLHLCPSEDAFQLRDLHKRGGDERGEEASPGLSKAETLAYVPICRQKVFDTMATETAESLAGPSGFSYRKFSRAELHIYNIRHIQHHTGQMSAYLRRVAPAQIGQRSLPWIGTGWR